MQGPSAGRELLNSRAVVGSTQQIGTEVARERLSTIRRRGSGVWGTGVDRGQGLSVCRSNTVQRPRGANDTQQASSLLLQDKADLKRQLEQLSRQCQWLVLWLDCDREGENISFEVGKGVEQGVG